MFAKLLITTAALSFTSAALAFTVECNQDLVTVEKTKLPKKDYARFELKDSLLCRWVESDSEPTSSVLFQAPRSSSSTEIEIATYLDPKGTTATQVALLDEDYKPIKWIPFSAFRERKNNLVARFFVNPDSDTRYILIGGAANASGATLARTYSPLSSDFLNAAGLVTARENQTEFKFVVEGKIRVSIRKAKNHTVNISR